jgi:hypothetical protein
MSNTIDALEKKVAALMREIDTLAKTKHTYTFSHDDGNDGNDGNAGNAVGDDGDYEDVSNPSLDATDDPENGDDDLEDGEDGADVSKASINAVLRERDTVNRPGALKHSDHTQPRHKFEALTDKIKNDQGCPQSEAMAIARQQFPDVYRSFQRFSNSDSTAKRAPSLVEAEMMKGCSREVALQRVAQLHGFRAFDTPDRLNKRADDAEYDLITKANEVWADSDLSRCEALRETRLANPRLHKVLTRG